MKTEFSALWMDQDTYIKTIAPEWDKKIYRIEREGEQIYAKSTDGKLKFLFNMKESELMGFLGKGLRGITAIKAGINPPIYKFSAEMFDL